MYRFNAAISSAVEDSAFSSPAEAPVESPLSSDLLNDSYLWWSLAKGRSLKSASSSLLARSSSMSRTLWVWFSYSFKGVYREGALQRSLLLSMIFSENRPLVNRRAGGGSGRRGYRLGHGVLGARSGVIAFGEGVETRTPRYPHHLIISGGTRLCCIYLLS